MKGKTVMKRSSGILMHISSLPGLYMCGSFGKAAYDFADLLSECGFSVWQVLPFSVPDEYGSPYKAISAFAGNPYFIDLDTLYSKGLLTKDELLASRQTQPYLCEFKSLASEREKLLLKASLRVDSEHKNEINSFISSHPHLGNYCKYVTQKSAASLTSNKEKEALEFMHRFIQHEFFVEWSKVKEHANKKGVRIIGDLPIYVDTDSSDLYFGKENFLLDKDGKPEKVAGVPPDYFSPDGQLWGNPLYNWEFMKKDGYSWWLDRIKWQLTLFDGIRIDHFRAFSEYFAVDAKETTAKSGKWYPGPGLEFVKLIKKAAGKKLIIAEDLGDIDEKVVSLLEKSGLPGMRVFQFAFLGGESTHMPHNYTDNCVAYSGTHDNNTLLGYLWELDDNTRRCMLEYCNHTGDWKGGTISIIKTIMASHADTVIFPIQDILGYGSDTRMNRPGVAEGNWQYRVTSDQLKLIDSQMWKRLNSLYGRCN